jgi:hypothetical protein
MGWLTLALTVGYFSGRSNSKVTGCNLSWGSGVRPHAGYGHICPLGNLQSTVHPKRSLQPCYFATSQTFLLIQRCYLIYARTSSNEPRQQRCYLIYARTSSNEPRQRSQCRLVSGAVPATSALSPWLPRSCDACISSVPWRREII